MSPRDSSLALLVALVWGANFVVIDEGMGGVPPFLFLAMRFLLVALPLVFFVPRPKASWRAVVGVGAFMSLGQFGFLYLSLDLGMPAGLASLVLQAQVVFTIVIASVVLGERSTRRQVLGVVIGTAGLATVAVAHGLEAPVLPLVVCLLAALSWATGNVVARAARISSGFSLVVWSALVVPLPCLGISLVVDGPDEIASALSGLGPTAVASTLYTALGASLLGYAIFNGLMARYPAGAVVPYILLVPPVGIVTAWLVQDEVPGAFELVGGGVMLLGVALATITLRGSRAAQAARAATAMRDSNDRIASPSSRAE